MGLSGVLPDLVEACHRLEAYCQPSFWQKEVNRKEWGKKPASRRGEGLCQTRLTDIIKSIAQELLIRVSLTRREMQQEDIQRHP